VVHYGQEHFTRIPALGGRRHGGSPALHSFSQGARMLTKEVITRMLQDNYPYLATEYGVKRIGLFGSYAKGRPGETSDVDLVIEFDRPIGFKFIALSDHLEELLGQRVDILTPTGLQDIRIDYIAQDILESIVYV
jgi:predicted nucleotidyltransferase